MDLKKISRFPSSFWWAGNMAGKGGKGLVAAKTTAAANKDKDKKRPTSRSSRAGIQVNFSDLP